MVLLNKRLEILHRKLFWQPENFDIDQNEPRDFTRFKLPQERDA